MQILTSELLYLYSALSRYSSVSGRRDGAVEFAHRFNVLPLLLQTTPVENHDAVIWNDQIWHRGAINKSQDRFRWVQQAAYGRRYISQRFWPYIKYQMPPEILERANPRRQRLLGLHRPDNYG